MRNFVDSKDLISAIKAIIAADKNTFLAVTLPITTITLEHRSLILLPDSYCLFLSRTLFFKYNNLISHLYLLESPCLGIHSDGMRASIH